MTIFEDAGSMHICRLNNHLNYICFVWPYDRVTIHQRLVEAEEMKVEGGLFSISPAGRPFPWVTCISGRSGRGEAYRWLRGRRVSSRTEPSSIRSRGRHRGRHPSRLQPQSPGPGRKVHDAEAEPRRDMFLAHRWGRGDESRMPGPKQKRNPQNQRGWH